jgi:hypothetical protein
MSRPDPGIRATSVCDQRSRRQGVQSNMKQRVIIRWIHIVCSIPIAGYIYSPFDVIPNYAPATRFIFSSCDDPFGIVDVEGPPGSATVREETGLASGIRHQASGIRHQASGITALDP